MGVGEQSWCEGGKDGEMEMFQGGRERERQMNRQIITNAIIGCYSSNLIVPPKKEDEAGSSWARGRHDQAGRAGRRRSRGEPSPRLGAEAAQRGAAGSRCWGCSSYGNIRRRMQQVCKRGSLSRGQLGAFPCHAPQGGSRAVHPPWVPGLQAAAPAKTGTSYWHVLRPGPLTADKCISWALSPLS